MPTRALRPCTVSGCPALVRSGRCDEHRRPSAAMRMYGRRWRHARAQHLAREPLCRQCLRHGYAVPATVVDHIQPHCGDGTLFWARRNWQSLCSTCHARKSLQEREI